MRVRYSWETPVLEVRRGLTAPPPCRCSAYRRLPRRAFFLIVNGDTLIDVDVAALVAAHRSSGALVTMAVIPNVEPDKYSGLAVDSSGVASPASCRAGSSQPSYHFIGVQVAQAEAFAALPDNRPFESTRQLYPELPSPCEARQRPDLHHICRVLRHRHAGRLPAHVASARRSRVSARDSLPPDRRARAHRQPRTRRGERSVGRRGGGRGRAAPWLRGDGRRPGPARRVVLGARDDSRRQRRPDGHRAARRRSRDRPGLTTPGVIFAASHGE